MEVSDVAPSTIGRVFSSTRDLALVIAQTSMNTAIKMERIADASPRFQARMAGAIAWITSTAGFASVIRGRLVVYGDAAATAHNIMAHELLFRLAFAGDVISILYIAYTLLLYNLFKPVSRSLSLLAASFSLVGCAAQAVICLFHLAPLVVLGGAQSLSALTRSSCRRWR